MEEILKYIAAGGGVGVSATWAYWLWKLEPRMRAIEEAIARQGRIDLLRLAASPQVHPVLKEETARLIGEIDASLKPKP